jgi:nucleoside-diphosphate-sugar epimerase
VEVRDTAPLRDFVYVGDVVDALLRSGDAPGAVGEEILLASGRAVSVGSVVRRVVAIASGGAPAEEEESPSLQADCVYGDAAKARALLGWTPVTDLNTGLAETVAWRRGATEGR